MSRLRHVAHNMPGNTAVDRSGLREAAKKIRRKHRDGEESLVGLPSEASVASLEGSMVDRGLGTRGPGQGLSKFVSMDRGALRRRLRCGAASTKPLPT